MTTTPKNTVNWFKKAVPNPTAKNLRVQLGCHLEEVSEMFEAINVEFKNPYVVNMWKHLGGCIYQMGEDLMVGRAFISGIDAPELLDALCDQQVTGVGVAHMLGMDIELGMQKVNASNWSKFDADGNPIFDANGKIKKGPDYFQPDLFDCIPPNDRMVDVLEWWMF